MNSVLSATIDKHCPQFNTNVTNGTAKKILETIPAYFDDIIRSSIRSLNSKIPLKYEGYRLMSPKEEFNATLVNDNNKMIYDLAESYIYMVEYVFDYKGEKIIRPLYLPYAEDGNIIRVSNTQYHIIPVLSDTVISPSWDKIFLRLLKNKLTFESQSRNFIVNGEKIPGKVVYTNIVKTDTMKITDNIGKPLTAVSIYVLGEHGFRKTMQKYFNTDKWIVTDKELDDKTRNEYNVFESSRVKPRSLKDSQYTGHAVKICIHKSILMTPLMENFIFGVIYSLDILPNESIDMISSIYKGNVEDEKMFWRIMLGRLIYKNSFTVDRIIVDMDNHYDDLQGYLDNQIKAKLSENGIIVDDFFDLLMRILENYNIWLINSKEYNSNIRNRYIDILYYIMYDLIVGFNKVILALNKRITKKTDGILEKKEIIKTMIAELSPRKIFATVKPSSPALCLLTVDSSLDIKYPKITAVLED